MIPEWLDNGDLPPGVHFAQWAEVEERLAFNPRRRRLLAGFREACDLLRRAGCGLVYLDGSFVTTKPHPGDFDACWDIQDVDEEALDPVFWDFLHGPRRRSGDSSASSFRRSCPRARPEERSSSSSR
ncbi:MAG: hypothetical protein K2X03_04050 [Bryobacteraceae bacterium]|nr:hypothetical protein [Bryobacteraceae bacterium]